MDGVTNTRHDNASRREIRKVRKVRGRGKRMEREQEDCTNLVERRVD